MRSRASSLPRWWWRSVYFVAAAGERLGVLGVELGELGEHGLAVGGELRGPVGSRRVGSTVTASSSGMSTWRERSHSPSALACGSKRALDGDALAEQPVDDEVEGAQVRQHVARDRQLRRLGEQRGAARRRSARGEPALRRRRCGPRRRRWRCRPCRRSGPRRPCPSGHARRRRAAARLAAAAARRRRPSGAASRSAGSIGDRRAVGEDGHVRRPRPRRRRRR